MANSIFIVEDDALLAWALAAAVEDLGYQVAGTVASAERAVPAILAAAPMAVIMDIRLAGHQTGLDAARAVRARSDVPILFCTAYADVPEVVQEAKAIGRTWMLGKPVSEARLQEVLTLLLGLPLTVMNREDVATTT